VPDIAKKLKPSKKKQRIYYTYTTVNATAEGAEGE
jgi:hypothetical protein